MSDRRLANAVGPEIDTARRLKVFTFAFQRMALRIGEAENGTPQKRAALIRIR